MNLGSELYYESGSCNRHNLAQSAVCKTKEKQEKP